MEMQNLATVDPVQAYEVAQSRFIETCTTNPATGLTTITKRDPVRNFEVSATAVQPAPIDETFRTVWMQDFVGVHHVADY